MNKKNYTEPEVKAYQIKLMSSVMGTGGSVDPWGTAPFDSNTTW